MLLQKLYDRFLSDTGLEDDIYKSVFLKLGSVLEIINNLQISSAKIDLGNHSYVKLLDFQNINSIDINEFDVIFNLFTDAITYDKDDLVRVDFIPSTDSISAINGMITVTDDLLTIKKSGMYILMFPKYPFTNICSEFYKYFPIFTTLFVNPLPAIPEPLVIVFKAKDKETTDDVAIHKGSVETIQKRISQKQSLIQGLNEELSSLLQQLALLDSKRKELQQKLYEIDSFGDTRKTLLTEKDTFLIQYHGLEDGEKRLAEQIALLEKTLDEVNKVFISYQNTQVKEALKNEADTLQQLRTKKILIEKQINTLNELLENSRIQKDAVIAQLQEVNSRLEELDKIDVRQLPVIQKELSAVVEEVNSLQNKVSGLQKRVEIETQSLSTLQSHHMSEVYSSVASSNIEDIYRFLSTSTKTQYVTVVENYIRYFVAYYVQKYASSLSSSYSVTDSMLSSLYLVLHDWFNVTPPVVITPYNLAITSSTRVIKVQ